jgi:hypothetical protein
MWFSALPPSISGLLIEDQRSKNGDTETGIFKIYYVYLDNNV